MRQAVFHAACLIEMERVYAESNQESNEACLF
jgi:hypothetical protein